MSELVFAVASQEELKACAWIVQSTSYLTTQQKDTLHTHREELSVQTDLSLPCYVRKHKAYLVPSAIAERRVQGCGVHAVKHLNENSEPFFVQLLQIRRTTPIVFNLLFWLERCRCDGHEILLITSKHARC